VYNTVVERKCFRERVVEPDKNKFKKLLDEEEHFYWIGHLRQCLNEWGVIPRYYTIAQLCSVPDSLQVGDLIFLPGWQHVMIVVGIDRVNGIIYFADHHGSTGTKPGFFTRKDLVRYLTDEEKLGCFVAHMPSQILNCMDLKQVERWDSTFGDRAKERHQTICCWHERLAAEAPWTSNPTPYACLNWAETRGTTWDTLILPRVNLVGCSSVVLVLSCTSNLQHGPNRTVAVRGSTDDGATWPHLIGSDSLTETLLPWATNQRKVRIAWIYKGPVQPGRFWCIDDIEILAKPTRSRDICVSGISEPDDCYNQAPIVTSGATVRPTAIIWNTGSRVESLSFTFRIGDYYNDTRWLRLYPTTTRRSSSCRGPQCRALMRRSATPTTPTTSSGQMTL
jgi:hypothetical protein